MWKSGIRFTEESFAESSTASTHIRALQWNDNDDDYGGGGGLFKHRYALFFKCSCFLLQHLVC